MSFSVEPDSDPRTFRLLGELDLATEGRLMQRLGPSMNGPGDLHLDLQGLEFMDSTGIHILIKLIRRLGDRGRVVLRSPKGFPNVIVEGKGDGSPMALSAKA